MKNQAILQRYGLFDARVPRYTSYPPANHFAINVGKRNQPQWLSLVDSQTPVSIYVHIPFCRRLCWFCACRTQGTKTDTPLDAYVDSLVVEINAVARHMDTLPPMARLHLGGGTPTLLRPAQMRKLLDALYAAFAKTNNFKFSVEIDPLEASEDVLETLVQYGLTRASIGVQDFDPRVQAAIGRIQSAKDTYLLAAKLRKFGIKSINFDLLYGLPHQSASCLIRTLDAVTALDPDRIALYGYAHVPHVSKRQVMIDTSTLPDIPARLILADTAAGKLVNAGYNKVGIDHFAKPNDSLAIAASSGNLRRNFQGYTADSCETLIGFGASAISRFRQGYSQNAVSTAAYQNRIHESGLAGHKGHMMSETDSLIASMIEALMCDFAIDLDQISYDHPTRHEFVFRIARKIAEQFPEAILLDSSLLRVDPDFESAVRIIAGAIDSYNQAGQHHSVAI